MSRRETLALAALACLSALSAVGCGGGQPSEATIYHDPALRPGVVEAMSEGDRQLLARLPDLGESASIELDGRTITAEAPYAAASGRRCRRIQDAERFRLACEVEDQRWVFVPDVLAADDSSGGTE